MRREPHSQEAPVNPIVRAMGGWQAAKVLMAANRLEVFNVIGSRRLPAREIAKRCGTHPRSTALLLNACAALAFLCKEGSRYANTPEGLELLARGRPSYMGDGINHSDWLWQAWGQLAEAVRTNSPVVAPREPDQGTTMHRDFILAMHNRAMPTGETLADNLDLSGRTQLFDVGGGPGTYSCFLAKRNSKLRCVVFDLPPTVPIAKEVIASFGLQRRVATREGDYFRDDFGRGNDVVLLSAILHSLSPARAKLLLKKAYDSLVRKGMVVVQENLVASDRISPTPAVLFSLNMLVNTQGGRSYTGAEVSSWMRAVGFTKPVVKKLPRPATTSLVIAMKP